MFEYISGKLIQKTKDYAVIDAGGIGYRIYSTMSSLSSLGEAGDTARLYIYMNIKNSSDTFSLYGFATPEERSTFEMILGVSGIGAKTAAALLSNVSTSKFALCVVTNDSKYLSSHTPGLGPKGAQRIILELKDKFKVIYYSEIYEFFRTNAAEYLSDKYFPDFLRGLKNQTMTYSELRFSIMRSRFIEKINQR